MFRIYKRDVRMEFDRGSYDGRFANPINRNGAVTFWFPTGSINANPEVLFKAIAVGTYEEYGLPMKQSPTYCEEYQVVDDSQGNPESLDCYSLGDYVIKNGYREPRFK